MHIRKFLASLLGAMMLCLNCSAFSQTSAPEPRPMSAASSAKPQSNKPPRLPSEVEAMIKRLELCHHFAGEISGDGNTHDEEVGRALRRYHCERVPGMIKSLKREYQSNDRVSAELKAAEEANQ